MADAQVVFEAVLDDSGIKKQLTDLDKTLGKAAKGALAIGITKQVVEGLKEAAKAGLEYNTQMEKYQTNFATLLGDEAKALEFVANMRETAAKTPYGMSDLASASQTLLSFGVNAAETEKILQQLGDISLGNSERLGALSLAFAQVSSAGKLTGQDLLQMVNAGFNPLQTIAEKTGVSLADLKEFMSGSKGSADFQRRMKTAQLEVKKLGNEAGTGARMLAQLADEGVISASLVGQAMAAETSAGGRFYQGMQKASQTIEGLKSTLSDGMQELAGNVFDPLSDIQKSFLQFGVSLLDTLNGAFDTINQKTPAESIRDIGSAARGTVADMQQQAFVATSLTNQLISLGEYSELTAAGQMQWKAIATELVGVVPELSNLIDVQNGVFTDGAAAIYSHIEALQQESIAQALMNAQTDVLAKSVDAQKQYYQDSAAYDRQWADWQAKRNTRLEREAEILKEYGMTADELIVQRSNALMLPALTVGRTKQELDADIDAYRALVKEEQEASTAAVKLQKVRDQSKKAADEATQQTQNETEALRKYAETLGLVGAQTVETTAEISTTPIFEVTEESTESLRENLSALQTEAEAVKGLFDEISAYKAENLAKIAQNVEGVYDSFEKADRVRSTTAKRLGQNIDSQIKQHEQYQQYVQQLKDMGASDALLGEFGFDVDSISQMQAIIKSGPEGLANIEAKFAALKAEQAQTTSIINDTQTQLDTTLAQMESEANTASQKLTQKMTEIVAASQTMQTGVATATDDTGLMINGVQVAGDELGLSEWTPVLDAEDNATSIISKVTNALEKLDGKSIKVYIDAVQSGFGEDTDGSHASGLDYVPYDGYIAELHKGETVLTAKQAEMLRGIGGFAAAGVLNKSNILASRAVADAAARNVVQNIEFNVPVQTPDEFANTLRMWDTYGLAGQG